jgi:hypothetical protein
MEARQQPGTLRGDTETARGGDQDGVTPLFWRAAARA